MQSLKRVCDFDKCANDETSQRDYMPRIAKPYFSHPNPKSDICSNLNSAKRGYYARLTNVPAITNKTDQNRRKQLTQPHFPLPPIPYLTRQKKGTE